MLPVFGVQIAVIAVTLLTIFVFWVNKRLRFWAENGVPQTNPQFLVGDLPIFSGLSVQEKMQQNYKLHPDARYVGMYQFLTPSLMIKDHELIKRVLIKDFEHFTDHNFLNQNGEDPILDYHLFHLKGEVWQKMRATILPTFTSSKMRMMFKLMEKCCIALTDQIEGYSDMKKVNCKDVFSRLAGNVIATCAFGFECDCIAEPKNTFFLAGKKITTIAGLLSNLRVYICVTFPKFSKWLGLTVFDKQARDYLLEFVRATLKVRRSNKLFRPDMIQFLMQLQEEHSHESEITDNPIQKMTVTDQDIAAQVFIFFFAGFDSASTLFTFMAYELATNPHIQEKLKKEIDDAFNSCKGNVNYETVTRQQYLNAVILETLRKWPSLVLLERVCTKDYTIKAEKPHEKDLVIKKGYSVFIPTYSLHHDPELYPDPEKFDPERFNCDSQFNFSDCTMTTFGVGPRMCLGFRFAMMEAKILFFHLLRQFEFIPNEHTTSKPCMNNFQMFMSTRNSIYVEFRRRKDLNPN